MSNLLPPVEDKRKNAKLDDYSIVLSTSVRHLCRKLLGTTPALCLRHTIRIIQDPPHGCYGMVSSYPRGYRVPQKVQYSRRRRLLSACSRRIVKPVSKNQNPSSFNVVREHADTRYLAEYWDIFGTR